MNVPPFTPLFPALGNEEGRSCWAAAKPFIHSGCCSQSALPRLGWVTHTHFLFLPKASAAAFFLTWQQSTCAVGLRVCVRREIMTSFYFYFISMIDSTSSGIKFSSSLAWTHGCFYSCTCTQVYYHWNQLRNERHLHTLSQINSLMYQSGIW